MTQYAQHPKNANTSLTDIAQLDKLFACRIVDRETVRKHIREVLREKKTSYPCRYSGETRRCERWIGRISNLSECGVRV